MSRTLLSLSLTASLMGGTALADVPSVAVDIAPVHSLVARVMEGVGTPDLIVQPGASPHEYSLRPSEAAALQAADLIFWIGPDLTPWLEGAIDTIATGAIVTELLEADGTVELEFRESASFEAHVHADEQGDDDDQEHADHDHEEHADTQDGDHEEHDHEEHADDEDHDHEEHAGEEHEHEQHGHDDEHAHSAHDPHAWMSPDNAANWFNVIAGQLSAADPDNAGAYFANASAARAEIETLVTNVNATLDLVRGGSFIVFHDALSVF